MLQVIFFLWVREGRMWVLEKLKKQRISTLRAPSIAGKLPILFKGDKVSEDLQKREVRKFQQNGDSQNRGFSFAVSFCRKTPSLRRKSRFLLNPLKHLSLYLWWNILFVTQKLMRLHDFVIFFKKTMQAAVINKKIRTTRGYFIIEGSVQTALICVNPLSIAYLHYFWWNKLLEKINHQGQSPKVGCSFGLE